MNEKTRSWIGLTALIVLCCPISCASSEIPVPTLTVEKFIEISAGSSEKSKVTLLGYFPLNGRYLLPSKDFENVHENLQMRFGVAISEVGSRCRGRWILISGVPEKSIKIPSPNPAILKIDRAVLASDFSSCLQASEDSTVNPQQ